jgi:hypothetical protein
VWETFNKGESMKQLLVFLFVLLASPAWAGIAEDVNGHTDQVVTNQTSTLQLDNAVQTTTITNEVDSAEANILLKLDQLESLLILPEPPPPPVFPSPLCGPGTELIRFVLDAGTDEICDNETGVIWDRTWSNASSRVDVATAQSQCAVNTKSLPTTRQFASLFNPDQVVVSGQSDSQIVWLVSQGFSIETFIPTESESQVFWTTHPGTLIGGTPDPRFLHWGVNILGNGPTLRDLASQISFPHTPIKAAVTPRSDSRRSVSVFSNALIFDNNPSLSPSS